MEKRDKVDISGIRTIVVGPAKVFREDINYNFDLLKSATQNLQDRTDVIESRLKQIIVSKEQPSDDNMEEGDFWYEVIDYNY